MFVLQLAAANYSSSSSPTESDDLLSLGIRGDNATKRVDKSSWEECCKLLADNLDAVYHVPFLGVHGG